MTELTKLRAELRAWIAQSETVYVNSYYATGQCAIAAILDALDEAERERDALRQERDEARVKALEEAAAYIGNTLAFDYGEQLYRDLIAAAIRALKDRAP